MRKAKAVKLNNVVSNTVDVQFAKGYPRIYIVRGYEIHIQLFACCSLFQTIYWVCLLFFHIMQNDTIDLIIFIHRIPYFVSFHPE